MAEPAETSARLYAHDALEFARALTFFDAIFAFSVTLLITTVDDFRPAAWTSLQALWNANGSELIGFAISFVVVIVFWRANHQLMSEFRALDATLITINCAVMFGIVLIPFTTEAMGSAELEDLPLPPALYALNIAYVYIVQVSMVFIADRRGMRAHRMSPYGLRGTVIKMSVLPIVFLASIPVAFLVSPEAAQLSWLLVPVAMVVLEPLVDRWVRRREMQDGAITDPAASDAGREQGGTDQKSAG